MKDKFFFPAILALGAVIIAGAFFPRFTKQSTAVIGKQSGQSISLSAAEINQFIGDEYTKITPAPGPTGLQIGPRMASEQKSDNRHGASLYFSDGLSLKLAGKNLQITAKIMPLKVTPSNNLKLGLYYDKGVILVPSAVYKDATFIRFSFAAQNTAPKGIVIIPATEGEAHGIEVQAIKIDTY